MNENLRVSDADREQVAGRLREHFAEGRLTSEELDERVSAALGAKTVGQLRAVMTDLPEPEPVGAPGGSPAGQPPWGAGPPPWAGRGRYSYRRRGPRLLPLALLLLIMLIVLPGAGVVLGTVLKFMLLFWLVACVAGLFAARRYRRRARRSQWHQ
jgi:hypothetical protein